MCSTRALKTRYPLSFDTSFLENPREYPHYTYTARNPSPCRRLAPLTMCLLVFTQLFSKVARSEARQTGAKTGFNAKWPFKVIQGHAFWDHCRKS